MTRRLMTRGRGLLLCLVLVASARAEGLPRGDARELGFAPEKLERVAELLKQAVDKKQLAGGVALVARKGKAVLISTAGDQDAEAGRKMTSDSIFRIASMTKPITSVAAMMLVDEGKIALADPLSKFIPEFKNTKVLGPINPDGQGTPTLAAEREITLRDLITHTSGITYGFFGRPVLGDLYTKVGVSDGLVETPGSAEVNARLLAQVPLMFQPGSNWEYGLNTDVLGVVIEKASREKLDAFFRERIFKPLEMTDTYFNLPEPKRSRLAALYLPGEDASIRRVGNEPVHMGPLVYSATCPLHDGNHYFSGGAGLVSTIGDYARFLQMLLGRGELEGKRLLEAETVAEMVRNQVEGKNVWIGGHGDGFGYGFGVVTEKGKSKDIASVGTFSWGGIYYTYFWVDPQNELIGILMTQIYPSGHLKLREDFKRAVYEALSP